MDSNLNLKKQIFNAQPEFFKYFAFDYDINIDNILIYFKSLHNAVSPEHFKFKTEKMADELLSTNNSVSPKRLPKEQSEILSPRESRHFDETSFAVTKALTKDMKQNPDSIMKQSVEYIPNLTSGLNWYPEIPGTVIFGLVAVLGMRTQKEADMVIGNKLSSMISAIF